MSVSPRDCPNKRSRDQSSEYARSVFYGQVVTVAVTTYKNQDTVIRELKDRAGRVWGGGGGGEVWRGRYSFFVTR